MIRELFAAAPDIMAVITAIIVAVILAALYGLFHSAYSRRLVIGTVALLPLCLLLVAIVVVVKSIWFPTPIF
jgi:chromate transport protein ChrA